MNVCMWVCVFIRCSYLRDLTAVLLQRLQKMTHIHRHTYTSLCACAYSMCHPQSHPSKRCLNPDLMTLNSAMRIKVMQLYTCLRLTQSSDNSEVCPKFNPLSLQCGSEMGSCTEWLCTQELIVLNVIWCHSISHRCHVCSFSRHTPLIRT